MRTFRKRQSGDISIDIRRVGSRQPVFTAYGCDGGTCVCGLCTCSNSRIGNGVSTHTDLRDFGSHYSSNYE